MEGVSNRKSGFWDLSSPKFKRKSVFWDNSFVDLKPNRHSLYCLVDQRFTLSPKVSPKTKRSSKSKSLPSSPTMRRSLKALSNNPDHSQFYVDKCSEVG